MVSSMGGTVGGRGGGGWHRVLAGIQMVAQASVKQNVDDITIVATRATYHGMDIASHIQTTVRSSLEHLQQQQQNQQSVKNYTKYPNYSSTQQQQQQQQYSQPNYHQSQAFNKNSSYVSPTSVSYPQHQQQNENSILFRGIDQQPTPLSTFSGLDASVTSETIQSNLIIDSNVIISSSSDALTQQQQSTVPKQQQDLTITSTTTNIIADTSSSLSSVATENQIRPPNSMVESSSSVVISNEILQHIPEGKAVPSTRFGRALGFANLGVGLLVGTAVEGISRLVGSSSSSSSSNNKGSIIINDANSDRLASTLCRMRGAALKMGQMLSIQDESLLPPALSRALKQVRQGAEAMPQYQLEQQLVAQLGPEWKQLFVSFDMLPFAAASIGQVHRASIKDSTKTGQIRDVVVKVQYPGVAQSIESDLRNLAMLVTWTGLSPKGLFIENVIRVGEQELKVECNYRREMIYQQQLQSFVANDLILQENRFIIPDVFPELTTNEVLTSAYCTGGTIDKVATLDQDERNRIGRTIMYLTMQELFVWRIMQTDPNWGNFLYDVNTRTTSLIDFGAAREYSKEFVDGYLRIVWASANRDEQALMEQSYRMKFLTGQENEQMLRAHKLSGYTVGEPFYDTGGVPFDFRQSNISTRMGEQTSVFLQHRLTPPPEEIYTLHRKLAGAYMLCIKLGCVIHCRDMLETILRNHTFDDGIDHPLHRTTTSTV